MARQGCSVHHQGTDDVLKLRGMLTLPARCSGDLQRQAGTCLDCARRQALEVILVCAACMLQWRPAGPPFANAPLQHQKGYAAAPDIWDIVRSLACHLIMLLL